MPLRRHYARPRQEPGRSYWQKPVRVFRFALTNYLTPGAYMQVSVLAVMSEGFWALQQLLVILFGIVGEVIVLELSIGQAMLF